MKIFNDTLKTNGKWSRKSLTIFVTFIFTLNSALYLITADLLGVKSINVYAFQVFLAMLSFLAVLMGITEATKKFENKEKPIEG